MGRWRPPPLPRASRGKGKGFIRAFIRKSVSTPLPDPHYVGPLGQALGDRSIPLRGTSGIWPNSEFRR